MVGTDELKSLMEMLLGKRKIGYSSLMFFFLFPGAVDTRSGFHIAFLKSSLVLYTDMSIPHW